MHLPGIEIWPRHHRSRSTSPIVSNRCKHIVLQNMPVIEKRGSSLFASASACPTHTSRSKVPRLSTGRTWELEWWEVVEVEAVVEAVEAVAGVAAVGGLASSVKDSDSIPKQRAQRGYREK